jgi:hypothetical protein
MESLGQFFWKHQQLIENTWPQNEPKIAFRQGAASPIFIFGGWPFPRPSYFVS